MKVNIRERKNKDKVVYEYYFTFKGQRYSKSGFKTARKADKEGSMVLAKLMTGFEFDQDKANMSLNELINEFLEVTRFKFAQSTMSSWKTTFNQIDNNLLEISIKDFNYKIIQTYFNQHAKDSYYRNSKIKTLLTHVFAYAVKMDYILKNPIDDISVSGISNKRCRTYITKEQFELIVNDTLNNTYLYPLKKGSLIIALKLGYYMGLRVGEILSLEKKDVDLANKTLTVNKTLVYHNLKRSNLYAKKGGKTKKSNSVLNIPDVLIGDLTKWFEYNDKSNLVCPDYDGKYIHPTTFDLYFLMRSRKKYGFEFNIHMLRHSFAQNVVDHNIDMKTAQELMRHESFNTTMKYYVHSSETKKIKAINSLFD